MGGYVTFDEQTPLVEDEPEEDNDDDEPTMDLSRTFTSLPSKDVVFVS